MNRINFIVTFVILTSIGVSCKNDRDALQDRPIVGAIRWDGHHGDAGGPGLESEKCLGPKHYHDRLPFYSEIISDSVVRVRANSQEVMDREITYASEGGLDYWAFDIYPPGSPMMIGLDLYLKSSRKGDLNFCLDLQGGVLGRVGPEGWEEEIERYVNWFKDPGYQNVMDDRPLVYLFIADWMIGPGKFSTWEQARQAFDRLRKACEEEGLGNPYMVIQDWSYQKAKQYMDSLGFDAITAYATYGGGIEAPYSQLAEHTEAWWDHCKNTGARVVPLVTTGWDRRPMVENPVSWESYQKRGVGMEEYNLPPTPDELAAHLANALDWIKNNPGVADANAILIYAWMETIEGGWLVPTLSEGAARLEAISKVLSE